MPFQKVAKHNVTFTRTLVALGKFQFRLAEYRAPTQTMLPEACPMLPDVV